MQKAAETRLRKRSKAQTIAKAFGAAAVKLGKRNRKYDNADMKSPKRVLSALYADPYGAFKTQSGSAGINISSSVDLSLGNWSIDYVDAPSDGVVGPARGAYHQRVGDPYCGKSCGITFNLLNSTRVIVEDLHIHSSPYMMVTAFNGGGGHVSGAFETPL